MLNEIRTDFFLHFFIFKLKKGVKVGLIFTYIALQAS